MSVLSYIIYSILLYLFICGPSFSDNEDEKIQPMPLMQAKRTLRMRLKKIEKRRRKGKTTEKKVNGSKPLNSHRNVMSVLFKFFLKKMIQGELDFPFVELMLEEEGLSSPPKLYVEADIWSWKGFIQDLGKEDYFNIGFFRQWWLLPAIDEKAVKSVVKGRMEEWKEVHFFACLKRYFRLFLEEGAFYALFMDYREKDRFLNLEDYFTYMPCILKAMDEPENFFSLKMDD